MSEQIDALVFNDITLIEVPVTIAGKTYTAREANEEAAAKYRSAAMRGAKMGTDGGISVEIDGGIQALLVSLCLYEKVGDAERLVPIFDIRKWPARVVKPIFDLIKKISHLDEAETVEQIEKQITSLQNRLAKLKAGETVGKN